jgi:DNA-binding response OmpR family regulator
VQQPDNLKVNTPDESILTTPPLHTMQVLVVDDDREFASLLAEYLEAEGTFAVTLTHDGQSGVKAATSSTFDIIILDVGLPELNGFEALRRIRRVADTPVLMLTARGDDIDRILGLEIGADDYVPKPCNLRELAARLRAIVRRFHRKTDESKGPVVADLSLHPGSQSVYLDGKQLSLTGTEYLVLESLVNIAGQVVDKDVIARHALGRRLQAYDRSVDVHVGNLRKKLGPLADGRQRIKTVRGRGYLYVITS